MKKGKIVVCLLLVIIFAVFVSFYYNEQEQFGNFDFIKNGRSGTSVSGSSEYNSSHGSCSSYTPDKCPTNNCLVLTDNTRCAGNSTPSTQVPGSKNYNVPSSSYANDGGPATCGSAGYLKTCATKSLQ
jgi:hypothetical protein